MDHKKLRAIGQLTDMVKTQKQAHLAGLIRKDTALREQIDAMDQAIVDRAHQMGTDMARQAGADVQWVQWIDARKTAVNLERARLAEAMIDARAELAKAFGRAQASDALAVRADAARRKALI